MAQKADENTDLADNLGRSIKSCNTEAVTF